MNKTLVKEIAIEGAKIVGVAATLGVGTLCAMTGGSVIGRRAGKTIRKAVYKDKIAIDGEETKTRVDILNEDPNEAEIKESEG